MPGGQARGIESGLGIYPQGGHLGKRGPREVVDELESDWEVGLLLSEVGFRREEKQEKPGGESL